MGRTTGFNCMRISSYQELLGIELDIFSLIEIFDKNYNLLMKL